MEASQYPHLFISRNSASSERYSPVRTGRGGVDTPERNREQHSRSISEQLDKVKSQIESEGSRTAKETTQRGGTYVEFTGSPGYDLNIDSLENRTRKIDLAAVKTIAATEGKTRDSKKNTQVSATTFIPEGKIEHFTDRAEKYREADTTKGKPRYQSLIESISEVRLADLRDLWTDESYSFPQSGESIWWEVWLRDEGDENEEGNATWLAFKKKAEEADLPHSENAVHFPEHLVVTVKGSPEELRESIFLLDSLSELRRTRTTADFFTELTGAEQAEWSQDLQRRVHEASKDAPVVCVLDSGVNRGHPLLKDSLAQEDMHTYDPEWGVADNRNGEYKGHGTMMAGLSLLGDLTPLLVGTQQVTLDHGLESVKILPRRGRNEKELYASITRDAVAQAEIQAPQRRRVLCLAVTAPEDRKRGKPSAWSSVVDQLASGASEEEDSNRLFVVSAGNASDGSVQDYPDGNYTDGVHDPAQAWNGLTVGSYTEKTSINQNDYPGWRPVANRGAMGPTTTTSLVWERQWPLKPDIVMEGGNLGKNPDTGYYDSFPDSLQLISTDYAFGQRGPFIQAGDTSASTALASHMAAQIMAEYPNRWPETVRALMVHSASWTSEMTEGRNLFTCLKDEINELVRCCGHGVPSRERALYSAQDSLTLIAEDSLQPFDKPTTYVRSNAINVHELPWPTDELLKLGEEEVTLTVTLSYFIEPNPGGRSYSTSYAYQSHGLAFKTKTPTESLSAFKARVNGHVREQLPDDHVGTSSDSSDWLLGPMLRTRGSLQKDIWKGTAAALASKDTIAVYPTGGWWKERSHLGKWESRTRYSLIASIQTRATEVDLYTPVQVKLRTPVQIDYTGSRPPQST